MISTAICITLQIELCVLHFTHSSSVWWRLQQMPFAFGCHQMAVFWRNNVGQQVQAQQVAISEMVYSLLVLPCTLFTLKIWWCEKWTKQLQTLVFMRCQWITRFACTLLLWFFFSIAWETCSGLFLVLLSKRLTQDISVVNVIICDFSAIPLFHASMVFGWRLFHTHYVYEYDNKSHMISFYGLSTATDHHRLPMAKCEENNMWF